MLITQLHVHCSSRLHFLASVRNLSQWLKRFSQVGSTFTTASDKTMNRNETEIKVEVREFGYHLVQWLKFVHHFFAETCRTSPKFLPSVHFFLTFKSFNWYLWYLCPLISLRIKHFNCKCSCVRATISDWGPTQHIQSPLKAHHACTVSRYLEAWHQLPLIRSRVVYLTGTE